jgi:hypothetical protein
MKRLTLYSAIPVALLERKLCVVGNKMYKS